MPASCTDCEADPEQREYWKCERESEAPVWKDPLNGDFYHGCPIRFIPQTVGDWYSEYSYYKAFPGTAPAYNKVSNRFVEAIGEYEKAFQLFKTINLGKPITQ